MKVQNPAGGCCCPITGQERAGQGTLGEVKTPSSSATPSHKVTNKRAGDSAVGVRLSLFLIQLSAGISRSSFLRKKEGPGRWLSQ